MRDELRERRAGRDRLVRNDLFVGVHLDAVDDKRPFQRRVDADGIERHRAAGRAIDHQRLARHRIAHEQAVRSDEVRRRRAVFQKGNIEPVAWMLVQEDVDHRE